MTVTGSDLLLVLFIALMVLGVAFIMRQRSQP